MPLILREQGSGIQQMLQRLTAERGVKLQVLLESSSVPFIKDLVAKQVGVSVLTRISVEEEEHEGTLAVVPFAEDGLWLHIDIVTAKEGYRSTATNRFLEYLASVVEEEAAKESTNT